MGRQGISALIASFRENYQDLLRFLTRRTGNADRATDLAPGNCLRLATLQPANLDTEGSRAPVYRVAGSLAIDTLRREGRIATGFVFLETGEGGADPARSVEASVPAPTARNK